MSDIINFTSGTKAKSSEVNTNFQRSFYQGGLLSNMNYGNVTVTDSSTQITTSNTDRHSIIIRNNSVNNIYVGDSSVTVANGFRLIPGESIYIINKNAIHGIGDVASNDVRYLEVTR